jgi:hypothetical protein
LADLLAEKPSNQVRIWPIDPLQKVLLVGCLMILLLLIVLFGLYVALAILSPEQLDKLAFQPTNEDEMGEFWNYWGLRILGDFCKNEANTYFEG